MVILVTGAGGSSGRELVRYLTTHPQHSGGADRFEGVVRVHQVIRPHAPESKAPSPLTHFCDLSSAEMVRDLITTVRPDRIYHLAGSFSGDFETDFAANVTSTRHLLDAVKQTAPECRVLVVGSAAEYGVVTPEENPISEAHPLSPVSVYGLTKVYQTELMNFYCRAHGLNIVMARPFNLLGEGMSTRLFVGRVQEQMRRYQEGSISTITVGNLEHKRDYLNVSDAVAHYVTIAERGTRSEVYNVGSGTSTSIRELLESLLQEAGIPFSAVTHENGAPSSRANPFDVKEIVADIRKLQGLHSG